MEVSSHSNQYQAINQFPQKASTPPSTQPIKEDPTYNNKEIYEASQGNAIRNDGEVVLTPQGQTNRANNQADSAAEDAASEQAKKDEQRANGVDYIAHQSKQSQVEIYLSVATDSKVELGNDNTASIIESLRDVQKQNNAVEAYATYEQNQKAPINNLSRGLAG